MVRAQYLQWVSRVCVVGGSQRGRRRGCGAAHARVKKNAEFKGSFAENLNQADFLRRVSTLTTPSYALAFDVSTKA
jgi:hypothetical protein